MRIGIDARMYRREIAGIGRYTRELISNLEKIDKQNEYVLFMTSKDAKEYEEDRKNYQLPITNYQLRITDIPHYSIKEQTQFGRIVDEANLDLIHYPNFNHPLFCKTPFVATVHDMIYLYFPGRTMNSPLHQFMYRRMNADIAKHAKKIIAVSEYTKEDFLKSFSCNDKIKVIYEAVSDALAGSSRVDTQLKTTRAPIFLYVGAWRPHKNLAFLISAFEAVVKEIPKAQLVFVGKVDQAFPEIQDKVKELGLENNVAFTDRVEDQELKKLYSLASAFVFPSLYEGFGLPVLEAMAKGVPVICSDRTSMPEVAGMAALYADLENKDAWSTAMVKVVRDKKLASDLIKKGLEQAKKFCWKTAAQETLKVYREVAKDKKVNRAIFSKTSIYV